MNQNVRYHMIKSIIFFLLFLLFQALGPHIKLFGVMPNAIFLLVLIAALLESTTYANLFYALAFGTFYDVLNGKIFGVYAILFVVITFVAGEIYHKYFGDMSGVQILFLIASNFIYSLVICIFFVFRENEFFPIFMQISFPEFLYNTLLGIVLLFIYKNVLRRISRPKRFRYF